MQRLGCTEKPLAGLMRFSTATHPVQPVWSTIPVPIQQLYRFVCVDVNNAFFSASKKKRKKFLKFIEEERLIRSDLPNLCFFLTGKV